MMFYLHFFFQKQVEKKVDHCKEFLIENYIHTYGVKFYITRHKGDTNFDLISSGKWDFNCFFYDDKIFVWCVLNGIMVQNYCLLKLLGQFFYLNFYYSESSIYGDTIFPIHHFRKSNASKLILY